MPSLDCYSQQPFLSAPITCPSSELSPEPSRRRVSGGGALAPAIPARFLVVSTVCIAIALTATVALGQAAPHVARPAQPSAGVDANWYSHPGVDVADINVAPSAAALRLPVAELAEGSVLPGVVACDGCRVFAVTLRSFWAIDESNHHCCIILDGVRKGTAERLP